MCSTPDWRLAEAAQGRLVYRRLAKGLILLGLIDVAAAVRKRFLLTRLYQPPNLPRLRSQF